MIRVELKDILEGQEVLHKLSNEQVPGRVAFRIGRLLKKLEESLGTYNEVRINILQKYAMRDENGEYKFNDKNEYQFDNDNLKLFIDEMNKLISEEVEIEADPIDFSDIENINFTPSEITLLEPFLKIENE